ncbi:patatin-like phospholipase family protein [Undibacter mobilis]|uniref:Phospholipase n=1 Tax=Undibacter mobilis TaxID=2292256 RepID=A0A371BE19_9BRAD|nr:patatin-like phospholipase family protein [Undibacter mobilis]RDV05856.1 phospholipase [Undibacter mobilis]
MRPTIGLALGGGAARGFAHIGVIRTLAAHGIVPDVIVGTSIGAVVGGCHAAGQLDNLETWARSLTTRSVMSYLDISLSGSGLIGGNRLASKLTEGLQDTRIEDLPMRFAAIATEFSTGHEIWLTRGRLSNALRASYALPGIFPPVKIGGRWLVDGALVNPVPVSAARALGARVVIAVNLNADLFGRGTIIADHGSDEKDDPPPVPEVQHGLRALFGREASLRRKLFGDHGRPGIPTVMVEAFNVMQDRITRARLAGDPPDVLISPRLGSIGWFDFHRNKDAIAVGVDAAEKALETVTEAIESLSQPYEAGVSGGK